MPGNKYPHLFAFYAFPLPGHKPDEMADAIHAEIDRLKKEDISDDELKMIKTRAKANLIRGLDSNEGLASELGLVSGALWRLARTVSPGGSHRQSQQGRHPARRQSDLRCQPTAPWESSKRVAPAAAGSQRRCAMKRRLTARCSSSLSLPYAALATPRAAAQATDWQQIPIAPLPAFHPQEPKRIELPNGMVIFLQEDHELPLIDGVARIRGGSRSEPAAKIGLVDMYGEVWRTGGTKTQTGDQLDDYLEVRAAKVETDSNADSTSISWSCLKGDFDDVFKVFDELLRSPEFRDDKLDLAQKEYFDDISRRNDDVGEIAERESAKLAYGAQNPYARVAEYATVAAVTRQDLLDWHHTYRPAQQHHSWNRRRF